MSHINTSVLTLEPKPLINVRYAVFMRVTHVGGSDPIESVGNNPLETARAYADNGQILTSYDRFVYFLPIRSKSRRLPLNPSWFTNLYQEDV
jgi:hypothetical protein